ncbi:MAG TPA: hypothetical protein VFR86_10185 [Burkholderiaceae bacterium]|nr:hypothetical protein [Burkholderiaceae bacterium]
MGTLFKLLGALVACYAVFGVVTGAVYAKYRAWGRMFYREEDALGYWSAIAAYILLAGMLLFLF